MTIVGIDLGNQYTKIYQIKNGHPQIVFNEQTGRKIHSNIVFKDKDRFFGQEGHDKICKNLKTSLYHLRSWLTSIDNDNDNQLLSLYDYSKQNDLADFIPNLDKVHSLSIFFGYLKTLIGNNCIECVISHSRHLSSDVEMIIREAAAISEIHIIALIDDTIASAVDYGFKRVLDKQFYENPELIVYIDIGHSCLKSSLVNYQEDKIIATANLTDNKINGHVMTMMLVNEIALDLVKKFDIILNDHLKYKALIYQACETAKLSLSINNTASVNLDLFLKDQEIAYSYTFYKDNLEKSISHWGDYLKHFFDKFLSNNQVTNKDISRVIITGGTSRVPYIKNLLNIIFPDKLETTVNLDESIAKGCSIIAALNSGSISTKARVSLKYHLETDISLQLMDKLPFTLIKKGSLYPITKKITIKDVRNLDILISSGDQFIRLIDLKIPSDKQIEEGDYLELFIECDLNVVCQVTDIVLHQSRMVKVKVPNNTKKQSDEIPDKTKNTSPNCSINNDSTPKNEPTDDPKDDPNGEPTEEPTDELKDEPTDELKDEPTEEPTDELKGEPTEEPTDEPNDKSSNLETYDINNKPDIYRDEKQLLKTNLPFSKNKKPIISEKINKIKIFEGEVRNIREKQQKTANLINNLENSYYQFQDRINNDTSYKEYLSKEETATQQSTVERRLDELYQLTLNLDTLETYEQELQIFLNKVLVRKRREYELLETINELHKKYEDYKIKISKQVEEIYNKTIIAETTQSSISPKAAETTEATEATEATDATEAKEATEANGAKEATDATEATEMSQVIKNEKIAYLNKVGHQVELDTRWFQETYQQQVKLSKWEEPILTKAAIKEKMDNLEKLYQEFSTKFSNSS